MAISNAGSAGRGKAFATKEGKMLDLDRLAKVFESDEEKLKKTYKDIKKEFTKDPE